MNLFRSEWLKLWTTRTTWVMLGIGLLGEALFAGLYTGLASLAEIEGPAADSEGLETVATGVGLLMVLMLVLGVLIVTTEFRHGTSSSTFLASPKRYPALLAKLGAALLIGLLAGLAFVAVNGGLSVPLFAERGGDMPATGDLVAVYAGVVVSFAVLCAFGFGVGAIVRNQVGAIIAAIAFFFVLSPLPELLPGSIGEYFPAQAIGSLHGNVEGEGGLDQITGGLVLTAWAAGLVAIGIALVCRRDVSD
ncbi:MAG TPA: ABC transporter permease subunit [Solirubrobacterales bacterium]|nr:ABC transporter permease subunit [Solirubrobacterales bacterium]